MRPTRVLLVYGASPANASFSYQHGWPAHFQASPRFHCTPLNLLDAGALASVMRFLTLGNWHGDAVVLLHSVFSNACLLSPFLIEWFQRLTQPKAYFLANEYKNMPEKLALCEQLGVSLLVTQTAAPEVHALYKTRLGCRVIGLPNTGLDTALFAPVTPWHDRPIDLGYRTDTHAFYLGHREREELAAFFQARGPACGLAVDISTRPEDRLPGAAWGAFLNRCKGQLGSEAGTDYFELTDRTRRGVNEYVQEHPDVTFEDVWSRFFRNYSDPVPMRIISGRNIEAAGTRTAQLLLEGRYDGYFEPDVHYIPLRKDFSNADEAIAKFQDRAFCEKVIDNAYRLAAQELTYERLIGRFADALAPLA